MISKHHIVLFIALTSPIFIFSQISTINLGFKRIINERNHLDSAEGFILYDKSGLIRISINKPVEQRMTLNGSSMLIYYPQEKKAFKIIGRSVFDLPFIQSFMMALQPKSFLEKQGFTCDTQYNSSSYQSKARWNPPEKAKKLIGAIELYYENSQLLQVIVQDPEYKNLLITEMRQYTKSDNVAYPLNINTTHYTKKGQTSEKLIIGKTYINKPIEQYNNEFKIPLGVKITDIKL